MKNTLYVADASSALKEMPIMSVDLVIIDPPYNTGNPHTYNDNFSNEEWCHLMRTSLTQSYALMTDKAAIVVFSDDNQNHILISIMCEVFGYSNYVGQIVWKHSDQPNSDTKYLPKMHNYITIFKKSKELKPFYLPVGDKPNYKNPDNDPKGDWRYGDTRSPTYRENLRYEVTAPNGNIIQPPPNGWRWSEPVMLEKIASKEVVFTDNKLMRKIYKSSLKGSKPGSVWNPEFAGSSREAMQEINAVFGYNAFSTPKPTKLIRTLIEMMTDKDAHILDFFAGSGTTAVATEMQNIIDGGTRSWTLVQKDELTSVKSEAYKHGFQSVADICRFRLNHTGLVFEVCELA